MKIGLCGTMSVGKTTLVNALKELPEDLKQYKVDTELPSVENQSDKWITEDGDSFYYDMNETI